MLIVRQQITDHVLDPQAASFNFSGIWNAQVFEQNQRTIVAFLERGVTEMELVFLEALRIAALKQG